MPLPGAGRIAAALRLASSRLRTGWRPAVDSIAAATLAWLIGTRLVGHPTPFFAPAAALIVLGQARGVRMRRAVEIVLGVAAGVLLADLVAHALGPHTTWTVFVVIAMTLVIATVVDASGLLVVQAAVSAVYVAVVTPNSHMLIPSRFLDALVGGGVAIVVSQVSAAADPVAPLALEAQQVFDEVAGVLADTAAAVDGRDEAAAQAALDRARSIDASVTGLQDAVAAAGESLRLHYRRRQHLLGVRAFDTALVHMDRVVRNVRVLARAGVTLTRQGVPPPPELSAALRCLIEAVRAAEQTLLTELGSTGTTDAGCAEQVETAALDAVRVAGRLLPDGPPLPLIMIVGQLRATAIDLMRGTGADDIDVLSRVDEAIGLPPV